MYSKLVNPDVSLCKTYLEGIKEIQEFGYLIGKLDVAYLKSNFEEYIEQIKDWEKGIKLPNGFVPQTERWLINDQNEYMGTIKIKHHISNEYLSTIGGHIGYFIVPRFRKFGLGANMLKMALPIAKDIGLQRVLITCRIDNIASKKIIEKNGGIWESEIKHQEGYYLSRFWINLDESPYH